MNDFSFRTTDETNRYCGEVVECVMRFGKMERKDAVSLINSYWSDKPDFTEEDFRLHEDPYYWAMCMLYPANSGYDWTQDPERRDTPDDLTKRWYG